MLGGIGGSSTCLSQNVFAKTLAVRSPGPRARISLATDAGTATVSPAKRSRSGRPARHRQMSGDALTTAASAIGQLASERVEVDRKSVYALACKCQNEVGAVETRDLRCSLLRDQATRVPVHSPGKT